MLRVHSFPALVPLPNQAARIAAPPYDTLDDAEARRLAGDRPECFLHVTRAEVDFPPGTSSDDPRVHLAACAKLREMERTGLLQRQPSAMFLYRIAGRGHRQIGVVGCCDVEAYERGEIVKHERTRPDKETERAHHFAACCAHTEPVLLAHRDDQELEEMVRRDSCDRPRCHFMGPDGATHTIWTLADPQRYEARFAALEKAYICDGHHRASASAMVWRDKAHPEEGTVAPPGARRQDGSCPPCTANGEAARILAVLFPFSTLRILPYHRLVRDLNGLSPERFRKRLETIGHVEPAQRPLPENRGAVGVYVSGEWLSLTFDPILATGASPAESLDVAALQRLVLDPVLGIADPRRDARIEFVGGVKGPEWLSAKVDAGEAAVAFALHPTSLHEVLAVAEGGGIMPPKSTWFDPKPVSGLFVHPWGV